ncbi:MAG TPA: hypothetical protein VK809_05730 [Bacteroidia bacterium]|jgi:hypothetical protein|nr:hypothetical protein [Bacteroidia bacterium]
MIFSENTGSYSLNTTPLKSMTEFNSGLWLVLIGVNEIPPHIALISDGKYYSQSVRKVDCATLLERFLGAIERKQIPTLLVQFGSAAVGVQNIEPLQKIFRNLNPLNTSQETCLSPIKKFFTEQVCDEFGNINYVFELLATAESKGLITECVSLYCETTNSKSITLPKYTMAQIKNRINELSTKQQPLTT